MLFDALKRYCISAMIDCIDCNVIRFGMVLYSLRTLFIIKLFCIVCPVIPDSGVLPALKGCIFNIFFSFYTH